jgi:quinol monooxygenase YgiN
MSTHVVNEFHAKPGRADDVLALLLELSPESRARPGCEAISIRRNQDDPNNLLIRYFDLCGCPHKSLYSER